MSRRELIRVAEAAYQMENPDEPWLRGILEAVNPVLERGLGVTAWLYDLKAPNECPLAVAHGGPPDLAARMRESARSVDASLVLESYRHGRATTISAAIGPEATTAYFAASGLRALGFVDNLGLLCTDVDGRGIGISCPLSQTTVLTDPEVRRWERLAAHLTAAYRLRRRQGPTEAVVSPSGKIDHAEGLARSVQARERLRTAAINMDRARIRGGDEDTQLDLWQALTAGRWTLVDSYDRDGKRYLIARSNTPEPPATPALSIRESQIAAFAAMGHPVKLIAYELGLSESSVATYLRRSMAKLGLPDRLALAQHLGMLIGRAPANANRQ
jgi:DNA-binding CsgD family transcriptional regulator